MSGDFVSYIYIYIYIYGWVKCRFRKVFFAEPNLQKNKKNCLKIPCQNLCVTPPNGHI